MNVLLFFTLTTALVLRAHTRKSLTPGGIFAAILTAFLHGLHPTPTPFLLLITFYTLGTLSTKLHHAQKSHLTLSSTGRPIVSRTPIQVFCNSLTASLLTLLAAALNAASTRAKTEGGYKVFGLPHIPADAARDAVQLRNAEEVLLFGVVCHYAATTADTLSSELGILSHSPPRFILSGRVCPKGTNGGVTLTGLLAGALGAAVIAGVGLMAGMPWWVAAETRMGFVGVVTAAGIVGSVLDSVLGAVFQETVVDTRTGKVVEAPGGGKVLVAPGERRGSFRGERRAEVGFAPEEDVDKLDTGTAAGDVGEAGAGESVKRRHILEDRQEVDMDEKVGRKGRSRSVLTGLGWWDNNAVNAVMAAGVAVGGMVVVAGWEQVWEAVVKGVGEVGRWIV
ncbi:hypothetical protein EX30DRAFT_365379 [Ascodesmis nigricans]|uniref:DUF92-domain-containing protein n=1 Tax=Ascodesmis nigricans TaxID=341454 RepID=A0A4S2MPW5_9PEZI|nr:hypothetical protein EX30DRAFT_365379 [Ascodesmis nigricans]